MWLEHKGWQDIHILKVERNSTHPHAPPSWDAPGLWQNKEGLEPNLQPIPHWERGTLDPLPHTRLFPSLWKVFVHEEEKNLTRHSSQTYGQLPNQEKATLRRTWFSSGRSREEVPAQLVVKSTDSGVRHSWGETGSVIMELGKMRKFSESQFSPL